MSRRRSCQQCDHVCRPLCAAVAAAGRGAFTLDGVPRMRERPIQDLVDGLRQLGVDADCPLGTGCPPVAINARGLPTGTVRPPRRMAAALQSRCVHHRTATGRTQHQMRWGTPTTWAHVKPPSHSVLLCVQNLCPGLTGASSVLVGFRCTPADM